VISNRFVERLIVSAMIALPVLPVVVDYFGPGTYARWLLADAANQYDRGKVEQAQSSLQRAYDLDPELLSDPNFLRQFERIEFQSEQPPQSTRIWEEMIRKVGDADRRGTAAMEVAGLLSDRKQFSSAVSLLKEFLPATERRSPIQNNQLAYMRALAKQDLEEALREIDMALKGEDNESFLDTKAWVLHQMGRNEEALPIIDRAISMLLGKWRANSVLEPMLTAMSDIESQLNPPSVSPAEVAPQDASPAEATATEDSPSSAESAGPKKRSRGWAHEQLMDEFPVIARSLPEITELVATLRYHRMKILEALEKGDEAKREMQWLEAFCTKDPDELH